MPQIEPGAVVDGKYRVERVLGAGGMGYVVAARHLQLDQLVALKFMRAGVIETDEARARFYREAKASVRLRSEHVARVLDIGVLPDGDPYMVMEYLEGQDLSAIARDRNVIPLPEACDYVLQACDALAEAHAMGVIHRDVKLANLFVTRGQNGWPHVKVLDFGISKTNPFNATDIDVTSTASMLGSPRFMSPEQMRDPRDVDPRSDVWSLGVILYRLVAGRSPFDSDTLGRLFSMVMHEAPPPVRAIAPHLPLAFEPVVMRCLVKEREGRVQNVAELAAMLVPFSSNPMRAQQIAEKAAHMLSVPNPPTSAPHSFPLASPGSPNTSAAYAAQVGAHAHPRMPSGPPGGNETIDASVWGVTNAESGKKKKKSSRRPLFVTASLFLVACAIGGVAVRVKYIQQQHALSFASGPVATANAANEIDPKNAMKVAGIPGLAAEPVPTVGVDSLPRVDDTPAPNVKPPPTSGDSDHGASANTNSGAPSAATSGGSSTAKTSAANGSQKEKSTPRAKWAAQKSARGEQPAKPATSPASGSQKPASTDDSSSSGGIPNSRD